jgi:hypothetical protein
MSAGNVCISHPGVNGFQKKSSLFFKFAKTRQSDRVFGPILGSLLAIWRDKSYLFPKAESFANCQMFLPETRQACVPSASLQPSNDYPWAKRGRDPITDALLPSAEPGAGIDRRRVWI